MVSSYVGMMCVGRRRIERIEVLNHANELVFTAGFTFQFANGSARFGLNSSRLRLSDPPIDAVDPLYYHLHDDDPPIDDDDWPPASYCGYYGSRWCARQCGNDGSERLVKCAICEVRCCVEVCMRGTASRCIRCHGAGNASLI